MGGYCVQGGVPYVTLEALLESHVDGNAFALVSVHEDGILIDGRGTDVSDRTLPLLPLP